VPHARHRPHQNLLKKLGENVRRLRNERSLTQEKLAELVDVHPRMIQKIEYGQTNLLATTAMRLQAVLGCPWEELMPKAEAKKLPRRAHD